MLSRIVPLLFVCGGACIRLRSFVATFHPAGEHTRFYNDFYAATKKIEIKMPEKLTLLNNAVQYIAACTRDVQH